MTDALRSIRRSPDRPERLLVLLPGYGDRPEPFLDQAPRFDPLGRWTTVVVEPRLTVGTDPIWYEVDENGPDPAALAAAIDAVSTTCASLLAETGLSSESLVLCGFSQGGALALATALDPSAGDPPGAIAGLAAYLPHHDGIDLARADGRPILLTQGVDDAMVETIRGRSAAKAMHRAGAVVTWTEVAGGHRFDGPLLDALRVWLDAIAAGDVPHAPPI
jgi:predicted esterase